MIYDFGERLPFKPLKFNNHLWVYLSRDIAHEVYTK